jgi:ribosomal protein S18 acetylase RimI-like enzyme
MHVHPWPSDPSIAHFVVADTPASVDAAEVAARIEAARASSSRAVRTGALFPTTAEVFSSMGFEVIDTLSLLRLDLVGVSYRAERKRAVRSIRPARLGRLSPRQFRTASLVDRAAFGTDWGNTTDSLLRIRHATPRHRSRRISANGELVAFAITGLGRGHGYLQRLAVEPGAQRRGYGRALVIDSLAWMQARGATTAVVNTGSENVGALDLYRSVGFRIDDQLQVMELDLET